jgi:Holliday junction resolvasome RuvABC endonuclease subunit
MTVIAGIDPSLSATGVVIADPAKGPEAFTHRIFSSKSLGEGVRARFTRFEDLVGRITHHLRESGVTDIYLEGYSLGSKFNVTLLAEFGGILRWNLLDVGEVSEVAPTTLKKFVTGAGNTKGKDLFAAHIVKRYDVMLSSQDLFDAFGLFRLGLCCQNLAPCDNDAQREAVAKVMGLEIPKTKKPRKVKEKPPF